MKIQRRTFSIRPSSLAIHFLLQIGRSRFRTTFPFYAAAQEAMTLPPVLRGRVLVATGKTVAVAETDKFDRTQVCADNHRAIAGGSKSRLWPFFPSRKRKIFRPRSLSVWPLSPSGPTMLLISPGGRCVLGSSSPVQRSTGRFP